MAKKINKNNPLKGASKLSRVIAHQWEQSVGDNSPPETWPTKVLEAIAKARSGSTPPSSTRKKLVKPGNRKFEGKRPLSSELAEDAEARRFERQGGPRFRRGGEWRKDRARDQNFGQAEGPLYGAGGISKSQRLKKLLERLLDEHWGGV